MWACTRRKFMDMNIGSCVHVNATLKNLQHESRLIGNTADQQPHWHIFIFHPISCISSYFSFPTKNWITYRTLKPFPTPFNMTLLQQAGKPLAKWGSSCRSSDLQTNGHARNIPANSKENNYPPPNKSAYPHHYNHIGHFLHCCTLLESSMMNS